MSETAINLDHLSKLYHLGRVQQRHNTLRDSLAAAVTQLGQRGTGKSFVSARKQPDHIWALRNISFEVERGEVIGIIGRNGAGKSTLLKVLSRITEPTTGRVEMRGRVGSLLEVGTGFHPELTGRENIYLNGAILGMRRADIARRFDEIVAFAEVERLLDTPVKRYSSGMYVRLAFAVAAHLEPEILLVDEVLAVGDARFQKKCLGTMEDLAHGGRTLLFVSHNMSAVRRLCHKTALLEDGQLAEWGPTQDIVNRYVVTETDSAAPHTPIDLVGISRRGTQQAFFRELSFSSPCSDLLFQPYTDGELTISLVIESDRDRHVGSIAVTFYDQHRTKLVNADTLNLGQEIRLREGRNIVEMRIEQLHLNEGVYTLGLWMADPAAGVLDQIDTVAQLKVMTPESSGLGVRRASDGLVSCSCSVSQSDVED